jgi:hypothetical protein
LTLAQKKWSPSVLANIIDTEIRKGLRAFLLGGLISCGLFYQQAQAAGITGDITFTGTVNLNTTSAGTATQVTAWHGLAAGNPQVQDVDGDFATFVTPGDGVTFVHLWSFNSGAIPSFWSVDGFTFDLTSSSIASPRPSNAVTVDGVGTISGHGFDPTPGMFHFTTQDPSADAQFSFSAAGEAVPEPMTIVSLLAGSSLLGAIVFVRRRRA